MSQHVGLAESTIYEHGKIPIVSEIEETLEKLVFSEFQILPTISRYKLELGIFKSNLGISEFLQVVSLPGKETLL